MKVRVERKEEQHGDEAPKKHRRPTAARPERARKSGLVFEPDVDEPQTVESLAAQQRRFTEANKQDWVDVDLPS